MGRMVWIMSAQTLLASNVDSGRVASLAVPTLFSTLVYAASRNARIADTDAHGALITTLNGQVRYFAREDFDRRAHGAGGGAQKD